MAFSEKALEKLNNLIKREAFLEIEHIDSSNAKLLFKNAFCMLSSNGAITWHNNGVSVRFIFVDAENIGLKKVEEINTLPLDKVYVYSNNDAIKKVCSKHRFKCFSGYPTGDNQADFYIIANLASTIEKLANSYRKNCIFALYSEDKALANAFYFCCQSYGVRCIVKPQMPQIKPELEPELKITPKPKDNSKSVQLNSIKDRVFNALKRPKQFNNLKDILELPVPDLQRAMNALIRENRIRRSSESKRKWIQVNIRNHVR